MTINEITDITNRIEDVDGNDVYIVDKSMKEALKKLVQLDELKTNNFVLSKLKKDIEFIQSHTDFAIAFRPVKWKTTSKWIPCLIYRYEGEWKRVVLQYANCLMCEWAGCIANPTDPDLFITLKNRFEILRNLDKLPFCKCPKCGSEISSKAIWVEKEENQ